MNVPKEYLVEGVEAVHYGKPDDGSEAVEYVTPNGTTFSLAKDFMGVQFCKGGVFWPPPITSFASMTEAVDVLRTNAANAIEFFDEVDKMLKEKRREREKENKAES